MAVIRRRLGGELDVSVIGMGCMNLTPLYTPSIPVDGATAAATVARAIDAGITMFDTADAYGPYTNEEVLGRAIAGRRDGLEIATKFGVVDESAPMEKRFRADPDYVHEACEASLRRLGIDVIDLYYLHRVDPKVPIEETVGAMADLVQAGKVRYLGLSEARPETLRRAHAVHPIAAVQHEWSLWSRDSEEDVVPAARELGVGIVTYAPLGRGFLTGQIKSRDDLAPDDRRRGLPRFSEENFAKNLEIVTHVEELARERGCKPAQIALAWLLAQGDDVVPIPGADRPEFVDDNIAALDIGLSEDDLRRIDELVPRDAAVGDRYPDMRWVSGTTPALRET
jgi:aryl-alcohol dehydrogenase-like predicted oxidoreductase